MYDKEPEINMHKDNEIKSHVSEFLHCCIRLLNNPNGAKRMIEILTKWTNTLGEYEPIYAPIPKRNAKHIRKKRKTCREFRTTMNLGGYEMKE